MQAAAYSRCNGTVRVTEQTFRTLFYPFSAELSIRYFDFSKGFFPRRESGRSPAAEHPKNRNQYSIPQKRAIVIRHFAAVRLVYVLTIGHSAANPAVSTAGIAEAAHSRARLFAGRAGYSAVSAMELITRMSPFRILVFPFGTTVLWPRISIMTRSPGSGAKSETVLPTHSLSGRMRCS